MSLFYKNKKNSQEEKQLFIVFPKFHKDSLIFQTNRGFINLIF